MDKNENGALPEEQMQQDMQTEEPATFEQQPAWEMQPPEEPKKHKSTWVKTTLLCLLVAAVAFGGGFAGVRLAYQGLDRVVIKEVAGGTEQTGGTADGVVQLASENVADKVVPSVVAIRTERMTTSNFWFGSQVTSGAGSGVIISEDGYILTNAHVISGADTITVETHDGKTYTGKLVGSYAAGDIAVVKIEASGLTPVTFADQSTVKQGETVYAVGNPEGNFSGSITQGILSALDRQIAVTTDSSNSGSGNSFGGSFGNSGTTNRTITLNVLQFDAAVSPGNSGGGLFDSQGNLIGIVCAKSSDTDSEGLGFAIVGDKAQEIATALISNGSYTPDAEEGENQNTTNTNKAVLGITATYLDATAAQQYGFSNAGVYVVSITEKSTLEAGLSAGDRIISVDSVMVAQLTDVTDYLAEKEPGDKVQLSVERSGKMLSLEITLVENSNQ